MKKKNGWSFYSPNGWTEKKSLQDANSKYKWKRHNIDNLLETWENERNPSNSIGRISF